MVASSQPCVCVPPCGVLALCALKGCAWWVMPGAIGGRGEVSAVRASRHPSLYEYTQCTYDVSYREGGCLETLAIGGGVARAAAETRRQPVGDDRRAATICEGPYT